MTNKFNTLYAITHSLYSGRARAYLIKNNIPFEERSTGHESFKAEVLPKSKLPTIPTLVTTDGEVIRDGAAIIEHFEARNGRPCRPTSPRQAIVSALFDLIGSEGLLRPAMHYRWNYQQENKDFIHYHFFHSQRVTPEREAKTQYMMGKMQDAAKMWGVSEESEQLVESLYQDFLMALNRHLSETPYLLGWQPCIGDFGLLAPMYAHLGRDPVPARLMQQQAPRVYRWVERMNRADADMPEFFDPGSGFLSNDLVPETLLEVLSILAEDLVPETLAAAQVINQWLDENQPPPRAKMERAYGFASFELRGHKLSALAQPYRFFMLQVVQDIYAALDSKQRDQVDSLMAACGLAQLMDIKLNRRLGREGNLEIWL